MSNGLTATAELPGGRKITLRELKAKDELAAARDADTYGGGDVARGVFSVFALVKRSVVSIDGEPFDQSSVEVEGFRDLWSSQDWVCIRQMYDKLHAVEEKKVATFREGIKLSA